MSEKRGKADRIVSVGNHMASAHFSATIGDVAMVKFHMTKECALEQAEEASVEAFHKLRMYLVLAEGLEREYGGGALLDTDDETIRQAIKHGAIGIERQNAAKRFKGVE